MDGVHQALDTQTVVFDTWDASDGPDAERSYCQARFTYAGPNEVVVLLRDATMDVCRRDAEQLVSDLSRSVIGATNLGVDTVVQEVLARASDFVGGKDGIVLVPNDDPSNFSMAYMWGPRGARASMQSESVGTARAGWPSSSRISTSP